MIPALQAMGYQTELPEGTFYAMVKSPPRGRRRVFQPASTAGVLVLPWTPVDGDVAFSWLARNSYVTVGDARSL